MALFTFDGFVFDDERAELSRGETLLKVDERLLSVLGYFLRNTMRVVTNEELLVAVWGGRALSNNIVSVNIAKLRKALGGASCRRIINVYGRGYRFLGPVHVAAATTDPIRGNVSRPSPAPDWFGPCVGRDGAQLRLQHALERARNGHGSVCALLGEAGIGKTRLAEALDPRAIAEGFRVTWGRCHVLGGLPPFFPWTSMLRACESQQARELLTRASLRPDEMLDASEGGWAVSQTARLDYTLEWLDEITSCVHSGRPWLHVLDDAHWADAESLRLLSLIADQISHLPFLVLLTVRDGELPSVPRRRRPLDYLLGHRNCERIELKRLSAPEVDAYLRELTGATDDELTDAVLSKSGGNPFFMVELLRPWASDRPLRARDLKLLGSSLEIVRQNLRRLTDTALEVLAAAAVIGPHVDLSVLADVAGQSPPSVLELLEGAFAADVVRPLDATRIRLNFGHDLLRSVLYDDLAGGVRTRLHQRVAQVLTSRLESGHAVPTAELAHHLLSALPTGDALCAVRWAERAARGASARGAFSDASAFLRRALDALKLLPVREPAVACSVLFRLAQCERGAGEPFASHLEEALTIAARHGFANVLCQAGRLMSNAPGILSNDGAASVLESALSVLPPDATQERAAMLAHLSWTPPHCRDVRRVTAWLDEARRLAPNADYRARGTVLRAEAYFAGGPGDHELAVVLSGEMERIAAKRSPREQLERSLEPQLGRIVAMLQRGDVRQAERAVETFRASAQELKHAELLWHGDRMRAVMRLNAGEYDDAKLQLIELRGRAERLQLHGRRALELFDWTELRRQTSVLESLDSRLSSQLQPCASDPPGVHALKLRSLVLLGLGEEASRWLRRLPVTELRSLPKSRDYLATLGYLAEASVATGARDLAAVLYELLLPYPRLCVAAVSLHLHGVVAHFLGSLAHSLGERTAALVHFEDALSEHERLGLQPHLAYTRYEFANLLLESGPLQNLPRARKLLEQVRATATQLGMEPLRAGVERFLSGFTCRPCD